MADDIPGSRTSGGVMTAAALVSGAQRHALRQIRIHPDGSRTIYETGENAFEIWTLENFLTVGTTATKR